MSFSDKKELISDELLDNMLLSLKEDENAQKNPPAVNIFRLEMEAERRRNRIQLEIVTVAAFVSVISTAVFTAVFFRFMLPDIIAHSDRRTREIFFAFRADAEAAFRQFGGVFIAAAIAFLAGYVVSAVLLICKRNEIITQKRLKE